MKRVAITGANGFVGEALVKRLSESPSYSILAVTRKLHDIFADFCNVYSLVIPEFSQIEQFEDHFVGVDVVVHTAARVHMMNDAAANPLAEFRKVNCLNTLKLAAIAAECGVKRFIFISSVKVNGEDTKLGQVYTADDIPAPQDPYGISKMEAEEGLRKIASETDMEVVIIRPVLVYGPGVKANFFNMMRWLHRGIPLPLGAIDNKRSFVALDNLIDLIATCIEHPAAANQTFLVADGEDLSTSDLLRRMGSALNTPARLIPIPRALLVLMVIALRKQSIEQRLCNSLQVDISKTRELLEWSPPLSVDDGLRQTAHFYLDSVAK